jgi:hypothetical protein
MNRHRVFLCLTALEVLGLGLLFWHGSQTVAARQRTDLPVNQTLVRGLGLTDLSIWTEARYTRHPSQSDRFTPFQDFPSSLEHFPAGSILAPPDLTAAASPGR